MMNRNFGASPDLLVNLALSAGIHLAVLGVFVWAWPQERPTARDDVKTPAAAQTEAAPAAEPSAPPPPEAVPAQERVALTPSAPAKTESKPVKPKPKSEVKPAAAKVETAPKAAEPETEWYTVQKGDTLTAIARGCGCKPAELARLNGKTLKEMENIQVGRKIKVLKSDATP